MLTSADVCCRYLSGDYEGAQSALADAIAMDPSHSSGHMLMAKILIELGRFREANASLEQALSLSFQVCSVYSVYYVLYQRKSASTRRSSRPSASRSRCAQFTQFTTCFTSAKVQIRVARAGPQPLVPGVLSLLSLLRALLAQKCEYREANASLEQALSLSRAVQKYKYRDLYWYKSTNTDS
jgi:tetratricopeptide (TPR) repeat protein